MIGNGLLLFRTGDLARVMLINTRMQNREFKITVGLSETGTGRAIGESEAGIMAQRIEDSAASVFPGATFVRGAGVWNSIALGVVRDNVLVITTVLPDTAESMEQARAFAKSARNQAQQAAVCFQHAPVNFEIL